MVSKDGIRVDPLKVKAILALPPPNNITQLQSLQGKEKFLRRFICNYAEITKGFMRLMQKDVPFIWDAISQCSFDDLKHALMHTPLLHPPNYVRDYILYLVASASTISMVLVQEDDDGAEHVIYYLSKILSGPELVIHMLKSWLWQRVIVVQIFRHYILLALPWSLLTRTPCTTS
jgi:hypothetical protein